MDRQRPENRLLSALPPTCVERILATSVHMDLPLGTELYRAGDRPRHLYFLTAGLGSVVYTSEAGTSVELSTEGSEGVIGSWYLLGPATKTSDCSMQVAGAGFRVPIEAAERLFDSFVEIRRRVHEYIQYQHVVATQIAACNRLHRAESRFVRWMLMVADRLGTDDLSMTQEFLSNMLGARRTTVAEVCADLARAGGIEGRRGGLRITERVVLEDRVCECYFLLRERFYALYREPLRSARPSPDGGRVAPPADEGRAGRR